MAINIEVKHRLKALEDRIKALEDRQKPESYQPVITIPVELEKPKTKLCPHCGVAPAYFFHVRSCLKKTKNNDDRNRDPRDAG